MRFISTLPLFSFPREAEQARLPKPGDFSTEDPQIPSREQQWILQPEPLFRELLLLFPAFPIYTDSFFLQVIIYILFIIQGFLSLGNSHTHTHTHRQETGKTPSLPTPDLLDLGENPAFFPVFFLTAAEAPRAAPLPGIRGTPEVGNSGIPGGLRAPAGAAR